MRTPRHRNDPIDPETFVPREMCYECLRPEGHCVCNLIPPFAAHCKILILQHYHERKKYYGTAKLLAKGLTNARVLRGIIFEPEQLNLDPKTYLLYPSASAVDCSSIELDAESTVVVIDGTWDEAAKILFNNPILKTLPCLTFTAPLRSRYRIRKQPKPHFLSTIESVAHLLRINAAATGKDAARYDALLQGFNQMVEQQLSFVPPECLEEGRQP